MTTERPPLTPEDWAKINQILAAGNQDFGGHEIVRMLLANGFRIVRLTEEETRNIAAARAMEGTKL